MQLISPVFCRSLFMALRYRQQVVLRERNYEAPRSSPCEAGRSRPTRKGDRAVWFVGKRMSALGSMASLCFVTAWSRRAEACVDVTRRVSQLGGVEKLSTDPFTEPMQPDSIWQEDRI